MALKVSEVCRRTGLTVRTLHHWEQIGLLAPSGRTAAGHRLYDEAALGRLLQIVALKQLGLSLAEVGAVLEDPAETLLATVERRLAALDAALAEQERLRAQLAGVAERLRGQVTPTVDDILETMERLAMYEKYYTKEQLDELAARREALGPDGMEAAQRAWQEVYEGTRAAMVRGATPDDPELLALRERARALIEAFTGGNPEIHASLTRLWREETDMPAQHGFDRDVFAFLWRKE